MGEGDGGSGGLVEDAFHVEPCQGARRAHRLALVVVVVGRHGDHRARHRFAQPALGQLLHFGEHQRGDLLQREDLVAQLDRGLAALAGGDLVAEAAHQVADHRRVELAPHQPLEPVDGGARVDQQLAAGSPVGPAHRGYSMTRLAVALSEGRPAHGRFHIRTDADTVIEVETSAVPLVSGGDFHGALVVFWPVVQ